MNKREIYETMKLCVASYQNYGVKLPNNIQMKKVKNTEYFIHKDKKYHYVIIQGTSTKRDWIDDFIFFKTRLGFLKNWRIHSGQLKQALDLFFDLTDFFDRVKNDKKLIIIAGHSLGGAIAQIIPLLVKASNEMGHSKINLDKFIIISLGCPKSFNLFAKLWFDKNIRHLRIVNGFDLVTLLPFSFMNFFHVKNKVQIGNNNLISKIFNFTQWKYNSFDHNPLCYLENWNNE